MSARVPVRNVRVRFEAERAPGPESLGAMKHAELLAELEALPGNCGLRVTGAKGLRELRPGEIESTGQPPRRLPESIATVDSLAPTPNSLRDWLKGRSAPELGIWVELDAEGRVVAVMTA